MDEISVFAADCHIAPDLPLADVLAEELDLFVDERSLVFVLPEALTRRGGANAVPTSAVGRALAQAAVLISERGWRDSSDEIAAVQSLADRCNSLAVTDLPRRLGLDIPTFRKAFARELQALFGWSILAPARGRITAATAGPSAALSAQVGAARISRRTLGVKTMPIVRLT
ncbi:hypothetical protein [Roseivivax halodurans]|uniref:hypothetical protein n=1 Tax=Roseivivax halodurans TaxID=93683 RepID=UPI0012F7DBA6|nr:hypothetical protein [Roseivivax halodurans]